MRYDNELQKRRIQTKKENIEKRKSFEEIYYHSQLIEDYLEPLNLSQRDADIMIMHLFDITGLEIANYFGLNRTTVTRKVLKIKDLLRKHYTNGKEYKKTISPVYEVEDDIQPVRQTINNSPLDVNNVMVIYYES